MGLRKNIRAVSKLSLVILMLISAIIGAFITFVWVEGYYYSLGLQLPEKSTLSITNATFPVLNTYSFNVTILNPSFSPSKANITQIAALTKDGIASVTSAFPAIPSQIAVGESETFNCEWNWANYTGQEITIAAYTSDGSGATYQIRTPFVGLAISDVGLDRFEMNKVAPFNLSIQNSQASATAVNVTEILVATTLLQNSSVTFPYKLNIGATVTITGIWNWTGFQGNTLKVIASTVEGYAAYAEKTIPAPTPVVTVTEVHFDLADTKHFNVTVHNSKLSTGFISVYDISVTMENGTTKEIQEVVPPLQPAYQIQPGNSTSFRCTWNWTNHYSKNVTVTISTLQGFSAQNTVTTPVPVMSMSALVASPVLAIAILPISSIKRQTKQES